MRVEAAPSELANAAVVAAGCSLEDFPILVGLSDYGQLVELRRGPKAPTAVDGQRVGGGLAVPITTTFLFIR